MGIVLALEKLYADVVDRFVAEGTLAATQAATEAAMPFGWREENKQLKAPNRIVWVPGDPAGSLGEVGAPRFPGRVPLRPMGNLVELFTCYLSAQDATAPENELAQYRAARLLYDAWYRALRLAATSTVEVTSSRWVTDKKERRFGATIQAICRINSMIPDAKATLAPVDVAAVITPEMLDQTDPDLTIDPAP